MLKPKATIGPAPVEEVVEKVKELGQQGAANFYNIPRTTLTSFLDREKVKPEDRRKTKKSKPHSIEDSISEIDILKQQNQELRIENKKLRKENVFAQRIEDAIGKAVENVQPKYIPQPVINSSKKGRKHEFILNWSDLHAGEIINPDEINDINEYNWDIMLKRHDKLRQSLFSYKENRGYPIDVLHVHMLGDFVSGNIHEELVETNELPLAQCAMQLALDGSEFLESLTEIFPKIYVRGVPGNHARFTKKTKAKQAHDSVDWMVYNTMKMALKRNPNIEFEIPLGKHQIAEVCNRNIFLWHGDGVMSNMVGVPWGGIIRRTNNLQNQYTAIGKPIYMFSSAHFHQAQVVKSASAIITVNGAIVGANEFSIGRFGHGDPPEQLLITMHPEKGMTDASIIQL